MKPDQVNQLREAMVSVRDLADSIRQRSRSPVPEQDEALDVIDTSAQRVRNLAEKAIRLIDGPGIEVTER